MAAKLLLIISILFLSLLSLSTSHSSSSSSSITTTLLRAADILSNSGFLSMSLTLQLVSKTLTPHSHSHSHSPLMFTIFSPSDAAFASSGQPSLSLLQLHFSPLFFTLHSLKTLPRNSKIPTLSSHHSLVITSSPSNEDCDVSLNGVKIHPSPLYDDGSLIIFGVDEFFDPDYHVSGSVKSIHDANLECGVSLNSSVNAFEDVSNVLRSKGYSIMAAFLELQLLGFKDQNVLTVFAPGDDVMMDYVGNVSKYSSLLFRHLVACKILWSDLVRFEDEGVVLRTLLEGFKINVTRSDDQVLMLNGVELSSPDVYYTDWLVVHGIRDVIMVPKRQGILAAEQDSSENGSDDSEENNAPYHGEF